MSVELLVEAAVAWRARQGARGKCMRMGSLHWLEAAAPVVSVYSVPGAASVARHKGSDSDQ